jgi:hypothetical protein
MSKSQEDLQKQLDSLNEYCHIWKLKVNVGKSKVVIFPVLEIKIPRYLNSIELLIYWCFNATFSNISAISWRPVLVVEEAGGLGENHLTGRLTKTARFFK